MADFDVSGAEAPKLSGFVVGKDTGSLYMWSEPMGRWLAIVGKGGIVTGKHYLPDHVDRLRDAALPVGAKIIITV